MSVDVVIPWKPGCPHRERALPFVIDWWERQGLTTVIGRCDGDWTKAVAVADALERSTADTLIVADADVILSDPDAVGQALDALQSHGWAVPHLQVWRWNETATSRILDGEQPNKRHLAERRYTGWLGGGITVTTRALYDAVPLDPRFVGWGQEDESWALALGCLAGEPWRGDSDLWHLWHPPAKRLKRAVGSKAGAALRARYEAATDPTAMVALIREAQMVEVKPV